MKFKNVAIVSLIAVIILGSCGNGAVKHTKVKNDIDSLSYAFGVAYYNLFMADSIMLNPSAFARGMYNTKDEKAFMSNEDATAYINSFAQKMQEEMIAKQKAKNAQEFAEYRAENEAFLEKNKENKNIIFTESGLQYEIIKTGKGKKPAKEDRVTVNYEGTLIDGTVFDSSYERKKPATFNLTSVIPGWTEGLQLMTEGSTFKFYIPYQLGYGEYGAQNIKPFSTLIFKVELLKIEK